MKEIELYTKKDKDILAWLSQFDLPGKLDTAVIRGQAMAAFPFPDWMELILPGCFALELMAVWYDDIAEAEQQRLIDEDMIEEEYDFFDDTWLQVFRSISKEERDCYFINRTMPFKDGVRAARGRLTHATARRLAGEHDMFLVRADIVPVNAAWIMMCDATQAITVVAMPRERLRSLVERLGGASTLLQRAYHGLLSERGFNDTNSYGYRHHYLGTLAAQLCELEDPTVASTEGFDAE